jgi:hypothetical protein
MWIARKRLFLTGVFNFSNSKELLETRHAQSSQPAAIPGRNRPLPVDAYQPSSKLTEPTKPELEFSQPSPTSKKQRQVPIL